MFLERIVNTKRQEVARLKADFRSDIAKRPRRGKKIIDLKRRGERNIIAEVKRRSPSKGELRGDIDPVTLVGEYIRAGAKGISVLTDRNFFGGSGNDLRKVAEMVETIPVLRKDFVVDEIQIHESVCLGADMVLLIAKILTPGELRNFVNISTELGLTPLVEVHSREELDIATSVGAELIGINNRDLETFHVDIAVSEKLLPQVPAGKTVVIESGIRARADMERLEALGADAFLIGEALVMADDPAKQLEIFLGKKNERSAT